MLLVDPPTSTRPTRDSLSMARAGQTTEMHEEGKKQLKTVENRKKQKKQMKCLSHSEIVTT